MARSKRVFMLAVLLTGCAAPQEVEHTLDQLPEPLTIELRAIGPEQRAVYYMLDADGKLLFGGGRNANIRQANQDAGVLTHEQRLAIWRIIHDRHLLHAKGQLIPRGERVEYELQVRAGSQRNHFKAADETVAGLAELDTALFAIQSKNRYDAER